MFTLMLMLTVGVIPPDWYTLENDAKTFRIGLPSKPGNRSTREVTNSAGTAQLTTAQLRTSGASYLIQVAENPAKVDARTLDNGIEQFVADRHATLGRSTLINVGGSPGREFEMVERSGSEERRLKARWVVSGNSLFMLAVIGQTGAGLPADCDRFLASLEIGPAASGFARAPEQPRPARRSFGEDKEPAGASANMGDAKEGGEVMVEVTESPEETTKPDAKEADEKPSARKSTAPTKLNVVRIPKTAKHYPEENLKDLPKSFTDDPRDGFRDLGPEGAVLVGVRVSYIPKFGGPKVRSAQPIYRSGKNHYLGRIYGEVVGPVVTVFAKPGYAVGGLVTHTGLSVDGFRMVFMKVDGDHLDPDDSYNSPWLGDVKGGRPGEVSSNGALVVGLQGRSRNEVNALGLTAVK